MKLKRGALAILAYGTEWAIYDRYAMSAIDKLSGMDVTPEFVAAGFGRSGSSDGDKPYEVRNGVAVIDIEGPLTKRATCMSYFFGGTSTLEARLALREAAKDPAVREILLCIDSPGGQVAGTFDLADDVARIGKQKRITAYVEDLCASAAYAIASQASRIVANRTAMVGSIGTYMVVVDSSESAKRAGHTVNVIHAGKHKGAGVPGTAVTDAQKAEFQRTIDGLNQQFLNTVSAGRGLSADALSEIADGRVWIGEEAVANGLIDAVGTLDDVMAEITARQYGRPMAAASGRGNSSMIKAAWNAFRAGFLAAGGSDEETPDASGSKPDAKEPDAEGAKPEAADTDAAAAAATEAAAETAALREQLAKAEDEKKALETVRRQAESRRVDGVIAGYKRDGLLAPAAEEAARKLLAADEATFASFVAGQGRLVAFTKPEDKPRTETANGDAIAGEIAGGADPLLQLSTIARGIVDKDKVAFNVAFNRACSERPDLATAYLQAARK